MNFHRRSLFYRWLNNRFNAKKKQTPPLEVTPNHDRSPLNAILFSYTTFCVKFYKPDTRINNNTIFLTKCRNHFSFLIAIEKRTLVKMLQTSFTRTREVSTVNHVLIARRPRIHWHHVSSFGKPDPPSWLLSAEKKNTRENLAIFLITCRLSCAPLTPVQPPSPPSTWKSQPASLGGRRVSIALLPLSPHHTNWLSS